MDDFKVGDFVIIKAHKTISIIMEVQPDFTYPYRLSSLTLSSWLNAFKAEELVLYEPTALERLLWSIIP